MAAEAKMDPMHQFAISPIGGGVLVRVPLHLTKYGVWVGMGGAGAAVFGRAVLGEPATAARILFVCLLLVAVVGLKATSGH